MIEVSIYYLFASIVGLPIITTVANAYYFKKDKARIIEIYEAILKEEKEYRTLRLTRFQRNREIISKFIESRYEGKGLN